jgi:DNA sulfur modification protein DndD
MELELLGWKSKGLRCLDLDLDLSKGDSLHRITLLQMPNGSGKTTTLNCLRAALTGEAEHWTPEMVRRFAPREVANGGLFELRLRSSGKRLTFGMSFDFEAGKVAYHTTFERGYQTKYSPPPDLKRFLTSHFVSLLVFDGELPQALLDPREARASDAIDAFFQLYLLEDLAQEVEAI